MSDEIREILAEAVRTEEARRQRVQRVEEAAREQRIQEQHQRQEEEVRRRRLLELKELREKQAIVSQCQEFQDSQKRVEVEEGEVFLKNYIQIYGLRLKAVENGTIDRFEELLKEGFGLPWSHFAYSKAELEALPRLLWDRQTMNVALSLDLWPFEKDPPAPLRF